MASCFFPVRSSVCRYKITKIIIFSTVEHFEFSMSPGDMYYQFHKISPKKSLPLFSSRPRSIGLVLPRMTVEREKPSFQSHSPGMTSERKSLHFCVSSSFQSFCHHSKPGRARTTKKTSFQARSPTLT